MRRLATVNLRAGAPNKHSPEREQNAKKKKHNGVMYD